MGTSLPARGGPSRKAHGAEDVRVRETEKAACEDPLLTTSVPESPRPEKGRLRGNLSVTLIYRLCSEDDAQIVCTLQTGSSVLNLNTFINLTPALYKVK